MGVARVASSEGASVDCEGGVARRERARERGKGRGTEERVRECPQVVEGDRESRLTLQQRG